MSMGDDVAHVVRKYLRTFATRDLDELRAVVADDVQMYGAGQFVRGRNTVEAALMAPGLTVIDQQIVELFSARHRVTVAGTNTYRQDSTGKTAVQSFCKMYQVDGGKIVRFWGEAGPYPMNRTTTGACSAPAVAGLRYHALIRSPRAPENSAS
jgi:ketosteroid isomerase-like protein